MIAARMSVAALAVVLVAAPTLAAPALAAPTSWTLSKVTFEGNSQVPTGELEDALPVKPGDPLDRDGAQSDLDAVAGVYKKHNVGVSIGQRLSAIGKKATLTYTLTEQAPAAPTVVHQGIVADSVSVSGNTRIPTAQILAAANIAPGSQVTNDTIGAAQKAIVALYHKKNIGVSVNTDWTYPQPGHVAMVFKIKEQSE